MSRSAAGSSLRRSRAGRGMGAPIFQQNLRGSKPARGTGSAGHRGEEIRISPAVSRGSMLLPDSLRQPAAEAAEELLLAPKRIAPFGGLHRKNPLERRAGQLETIDIQGIGRRNKADGSLNRASFALAAPDDPLENAQILAESGPDVTPRLLPEPVDPKDAWGMGQASPHLQPVPEVVRHVVPAEGQPGERD